MPDQTKSKPPTPATLTGIFDLWDELRLRHDCTEDEAEQAIIHQRMNQLAAVAARRPALDDLDFAMKLAIDMDEIPPETPLMASLLRDAWRAITSARRDAEIMGAFKAWVSLTIAARDGKLGEEDDDWLADQAEDLANEVADLPPRTGAGLAAKILMAGDLEMSMRPIAAAVRRDLVRLAGADARRWAQGT